jgi:hypothetical protein
MAAAVLRHAEGQQAPPLPHPTLSELQLQTLAAEGQYRCEFRLIGVWQDTASLGDHLGRGLVFGVLGEREDPLTGGSEVLVLPEPRLESGNLQKE